MESPELMLAPGQDADQFLCMLTGISSDVAGIDDSICVDDGSSEERQYVHSSWATGVQKQDRGRNWTAYISIKDIMKRIGAWPTEVLAAIARDTYYLCCEFNMELSDASLRATVLDRHCYRNCNWLRGKDPEALRLQLQQLGQQACEQHKQRLQTAKVVAEEAAAEASALLAQVQSALQSDEPVEVDTATRLAALPDADLQSVQVLVRRWSPPIVQRGEIEQLMQKQQQQQRDMTPDDYIDSLVGQLRGGDGLLEALTPPMLRKLCSTEGLPATGTEQQLLQRLQACPAVGPQRPFHYRLHRKTLDVVRQANKSVMDALELHIAAVGTDGLSLYDDGQQLPENGGMMFSSYIQQLGQIAGGWEADMAAAYIIPLELGGARHTDNLLGGVSDTFLDSLPWQLRTPVMAALAGPTKTLKAVAVSRAQGNRAGKFWCGEGWEELTTVGRLALHHVWLQCKLLNAAAAADGAHLQQWMQLQLPHVPGLRQLMYAPHAYMPSLRQLLRHLKSGGLSAFPAEAAASGDGDHADAAAARQLLSSGAAASAASTAAVRAELQRVPGLVEADMDMCHIISDRRGGACSAHNMQPRCRSWNRKVHDIVDPFNAFVAGPIKARNSFLVSTHLNPDSTALPPAAALAHGRLVLEAAVVAVEAVGPNVAQRAEQQQQKHEQDREPALDVSSNSSISGGRNAAQQVEQLMTQLRVLSVGEQQEQEQEQQQQQDGSDGGYSNGGYSNDGCSDGGCSDGGFSDIEHSSMCNCFRCQDRGLASEWDVVGCMDEYY